MFYLKFIVLFLLFLTVFCFEVNYCNICSNHVLCKYNKPGKGDSCINYNHSALLTQDDIYSIVNKINDRRTFIALGHAQNPSLPQAANMRKVSWSNELAIFAQRWVDQCNHHAHPDKSDGCRDVADMNVGQNIASISGLSPGLNVKSFVDIWFMQSLDYIGSVSYYNRSQNHNTDYLTQLIWAETFLVGCGKAMFYIANVLIERMVCNFGPGGNVDRKPVYLIGFPATQCLDGTNQDETYPALCSSDIDKATNIVTKETVFTGALSEETISSVLATTSRQDTTFSFGILNLLENTVKQELDPIRSDIKQRCLKISQVNDERQQKLRHISNITKGAPNLAVSEEYNPWDLKNLSRRQEHHYHNFPERGHSHIHHDHDHTTVYSALLPTLANNYSRYNSYFKDDYRRYPSDDHTKQQNIIQQCTRKELLPLPLPLPQPPLLQLPLQQLPLPPLPPLPLPPMQPCLQQKTDFFMDHCTRGEKNYCNALPAIPLRQPHDHQQECACFMHQNVCPVIPSYESSCQCGDHKMPCAPVTPGCPHILRRQNGIDQNSKKIDAQDENVYNVALRNGNTRQEYSSGKEDLYTIENTKQNYVFTPESIFRINLHRNRNTKRIQDKILKSQEPIPKDYDNIYDLLHSPAGRKKRGEFQDETSKKPFWQIEGYNLQKPFQLKSLKYTTLPGYKKKSRRNKINRSTEPITILSDDEHVQNEYKHQTKEKFLSFDELMNLRKNQLDLFEYSGRRAGKKNNGSLRENKTTPSQATQSIAATTNTSVSHTLPRLRYCTRKVTCTWTTPLVPGDKSGKNKNYHGDNSAERTPPGYVEGCSRTSTCTRDYLERNKITTPDTNYDDGSGGEDDIEGDYCERRSLDEQKRNFETDTVNGTDIFQEYDEISAIKLILNLSQQDEVNDTERINEETSEEGDCLCSMKNAKAKRFAKHSCGVQSKLQSKEQQSIIPFSFRNIYFSIVKKIFKFNKSNNEISKSKVKSTCRKF